MRVRFQADADLDARIVSGLKRKQTGIHFTTAHQAGLRGRPDGDVLRLVSKQGLVLVSQDEGTMPAHFWAFLKDHSSPGVFIVPQRVSLAVAIDEIRLIWSA